MPGVRKMGRDGREDAIALDDELFRVLPDGEGEDEDLDLDAPRRGRGRRARADQRTDDGEGLRAGRRDGRRGSGRGVWLPLGVLLGIAVLGWGAWMSFAPAPEPTPATGDMMAVVAPSGGTGLNDLPLIEADPTPYKQEPGDPGGLQVENTDKQVYERVRDSAQVDDGAAVEQLLPGPVRPVAPPEPEPAPPPAPAPVTSPAPTPAVPDGPEPDGAATDAAPATPAVPGIAPPAVPQTTTPEAETPAPPPASDAPASDPAVASEPTAPAAPATPEAPTAPAPTAPAPRPPPRAGRPRAGRECHRRRRKRPPGPACGLPTARARPGALGNPAGRPSGSVGQRTACHRVRRSGRPGPVLPPARGSLRRGRAGPSAVRRTQATRCGVSGCPRVTRRWRPSSAAPAPT